MPRPHYLRDTPEHRSETYLACEGQQCLYCGDTGTLDGADLVIVDSTTSEQRVRCLACERTWVDVYTLWSVREDAPEKPELGEVPTLTFYVTVAENMPHGAGYWEVLAPNESEARQLAFAHCPDGRWSFIYDALDKVHPHDRKRHGVIGGAT